MAFLVFLRHAAKAWPACAAHKAHHNVFGKVFCVVRKDHVARLGSPSCVLKGPVARLACPLLDACAILWNRQGARLAGDVQKLPQRLHKTNLGSAFRAQAVVAGKHAKL